MGYELGCPDCNVNGGDGPRCPKHETEYLCMGIENNQKRIQEIEREAKNELSSSRTS